MKEEIQKKYDVIIPPNDFEHRFEFSNTHLIDQLTAEEKILIEDMLITNLYTTKDMLIAATLGYLKSTKAIDALMFFFNNTDDIHKRFILSSIIYSLNGDKHMIDIAVECFAKFKNKYSLIFSFHTLKSFNTKQTDDLIRKYVNDDDYLVSYNARKALEGKEQQVLKPVTTGVLHRMFQLFCCIKRI